MTTHAIIDYFTDSSKKAEKSAKAFDLQWNGHRDLLHQMVPSVFPGQDPLQSDLESVGCFPLGGRLYHSGHGIQYSQTPSEESPEDGYGPINGVPPEVSPLRLRL